MCKAICEDCVKAQKSITFLLYQLEDQNTNIFCRITFTSNHIKIIRNYSPIFNIRAAIGYSLIEVYACMLIHYTHLIAKWSIYHNIPEKGCHALLEHGSPSQLGGQQSILAIFPRAKQFKDSIPYRLWDVFLYIRYMTEFCLFQGGI